MSCNIRMADLVEKLGEALDKASSLEGDAMADYYHDKVLSLMERIRSAVNEAEVLIPAKYWPYPTYSQLLFSV